MRKRLFFIMGKTNTGKDSIGKYMRERFGLGDVVSYTTRTKRDYEIDDVHHKFTTPKQMAEIMRDNNVIAYTKNEITGIEYCATLECMTSDDCVYIINPNGFKWFKENGCLSNVEYKTIFVYAPEDIILQRGIQRGDDKYTLEKRLESERDEFDEFMLSDEVDFIVRNDSYFEYALTEINGIMQIIGGFENEED